MDFVTWLTLFTTIFTLIIIPGPTGMNQVRLASFNPLRKCVVSALGATTVSNLYIIVVFLFLTFLTTFQHLTTVITLLQFFGVGYLLYLSYNTFRSSTINILNPEAQSQQLSTKDMYISGATVAASNPKDLIFFISFLPLFVKSFTLQEYAVVALTWTFFDVGFSVLYAAIASFISSKGPIYARYLMRFAGLSLCLIAVTILWGLLNGMF